MFKYPEEVRRIMYTTNPFESFNRVVRKVTSSKSSFPTDDSLLKLLYLVVMDSSERWTKAVRDWSTILNQLVVYYGDRVSKYLST